MVTFVFLLNDYTHNGVVIRKNEIGIVEHISGEFSYIQFVNCSNIVKVPSAYLKPFNPKETGDSFSHKVCNRCNRLLPVENFPKNQNGKNNRPVRRPSCNECRTIIDGKDVPANMKNKWNKKKPNMVIWQCPICGKRTIPGLTSKVVLDHDHKTGNPNAWICDSCNTGLGRFNDDPEVMKIAIKYLKKHHT